MGVALLRTSGKQAPLCPQKPGPGAVRRT